MNDPRLEKIKTAVEAADHIPPDKKAQLLGLIATLDPFIAKVAQIDDHHAQRIAGLVEASAQEATRKNPQGLETVLRQLKESVQRFEASHPDLVASVTQYSAALSALGI